MNDGDRHYLTELMTQLKLAERDKVKATEELALWTGRAELAREAGDEGLAAAAMERAERVAADLRDAEGRIMALEVDKSVLKHAAKPPSTAATKQAEHLLNEIADKPWSPRDAEVDRVSRETAADGDLEALKRKMAQSE